MLQFRDDTFGPIEPAAKILDDLCNQTVMEKVKAAHFGTPAELERVRTVEQRISDLEAQAKRDALLRSEHLHFPTKQEVQEFGGKPRAKGSD